MKSVTFYGAGDIGLTLSPDFSEASEESPKGTVRVQVEGIDVENFGSKAPAVSAFGWFNPAEAREIARYLNEMADKAEAGEE